MQERFITITPPVTPTEQLLVDEQSSWKELSTGSWAEHCPQKHNQTVAGQGQSITNYHNRPKIKSTLSKSCAYVTEYLIKVNTHTHTHTLYTYDEGGINETA